MKWTLPGTVLTRDREEAKYIENQMEAAAESYARSDKKYDITSA